MDTESATKEIPQLILDHFGIDFIKSTKTNENLFNNTIREAS